MVFKITSIVIISYLCFSCSESSEDKDKKSQNVNTEESSHKEINENKDSTTEEVKDKPDSYLAPTPGEIESVNPSNIVAQETGENSLKNITEDYPETINENTKVKIEQYNFYLEPKIEKLRGNTLVYSQVFNTGFKNTCYYFPTHFINGQSGCLRYGYKGKKKLDYCAIVVHSGTVEDLKNPNQSGENIGIFASSEPYIRPDHVVSEPEKNIAGYEEIAELFGANLSELFDVVYERRIGHKFTLKVESGLIGTCPK